MSPAPCPLLGKTQRRSEINADHLSSPGSWSKDLIGRQNSKIHWSFFFFSHSELQRQFLRHTLALGIGFRHVHGEKRERREMALAFLGKLKAKRKWCWDTLMFRDIREYDLWHAECRSLSRGFGQNVSGVQGYGEKRRENQILQNSERERDLYFVAKAAP